MSEAAESVGGEEEEGVEDCDGREADEDDTDCGDDEEQESIRELEAVVSDNLANDEASEGAWTEAKFNERFISLLPGGMISKENISGNIFKDMVSRILGFLYFRQIF